MGFSIGAFVATALVGWGAFHLIRHGNTRMMIIIGLVLMNVASVLFETATGLTGPINSIAHDVTNAFSSIRVG